MLISRPSNSGLKRLINIQKCRSSTKLDHCGMQAKCDLLVNKIFAVRLYCYHIPCTITTHILILHPTIGLEVLRGQKIQPNHPISIRVSNGMEFFCPAGQRDSSLFIVPGQRDNGTEVPSMS